MELPQLCAALAACVGPDPAARKAAEDALAQHKHSRGQVVNLLRVALEESVDPGIRQVAAIAFKNVAKRGWEGSDGQPSPLAEEDKAAVRGAALDAICTAPAPVRVQLAECVRSAVYADFPDRWPGLLPQLQAYLASQDLPRVGGALYVLRLVARKYEFRDEEERLPLEALVNATFPLLLPIFQSLLASPSAAPEVGEMLKLVCKVFWSCCYMEIPGALLREDQFAGWMTALHGLMLKPVPLEGMPADADARAAWSWWKAKKWVMHIAYRLFNRYGDPKLCQAPTDVAFAARFQAECSLTFLEAVLQLLASHSQGAYLSPRVANLLLQHATQALAFPATWRALKPHVPALLSHVVFPLLCFDDDDAELWVDDPHEYIRKGYDIIEDIYSTKTAAMNFVHELCKARPKGNLPALMAHIVAVLGEYAAAHPAAPPALARSMDGAMLAIGTLAEILKERKSGYRGQLEPMLLQHVVPLFESPHGHLRAKACWVAGIYADVEFSDGQGRGATFGALLARVVARISDPDLPVRVDAAVSVRSFLDAIEAEDLGAIRPLVPDLLRQFLELSQEIDNEDLTFSLEAVVERFGPEMAPYATGLCQHLTQQFWRIVSADGEGGGGEDDDGEDDEGAIAAYGVLRALCTVVESVASLPELMPALEEVLFPLLHRYTSTEGQDIFEEVMQILTYLTYYSPALSPRLWTLFPAVLAAVDEWAIDFFENAMLPLDNFISRGTDVFLASTAPNYLALTNQTLERVLCGPGSEDYPEDQAIAAPKLMGTILQHCRGRVDACVGPYVTLALRRLAASVEEREFGDALLLVGADALYYDAALTLGALGAAGAVQTFLGALSRAVLATRKTGKMKHFSSAREKKVVVLGLVSLLAAPPAAVPAEVAAGMGQVVAATLRVLLALKAQQEEAAAARGGGSSGDEDGGGGSPSDGSGDEEEEEWDQADEAYMRRLARAAARQMAARAAEEAAEEGSDDEYDGWPSEDEDEEVCSPIDAVDPFVFFAEALAALQAAAAPRFAATMGGLDPGVAAAVQGMMAYAAQLKQEQLAAAAAAAAVAQGGAPPAP